MEVGPKANRLNNIRICSVGIVEIKAQLGIDDSLILNMMSLMVNIPDRKVHVVLHAWQHAPT